jgi:glycosyltransferase involved in cell wall biosynthesis
VLASRNFETVIVRRELLWFNDYGNLFLDKLLLKFHPNAILDFDDDIAAAKGQPKKITNVFGKVMLENGNKFNDSLRLYKRFFVASSHLKERVLTENPKLEPAFICVIPTCVDYDQYPAKVYPENIDKITFGWIGGDHNYPQLDTILPLLNKLGEKYIFKLLVIGGAAYKRQTTFDLEFRPWSLQNEIKDIHAIDVGLMPLENTARTRGKGGFKLLQYMGMGVVSVASSISINTEIINHAENGFLCSNEEEWRAVLEMIMNNKLDFMSLGLQARQTVLENYTFSAQLKNYKRLLLS